MSSLSRFFGNYSLVFPEQPSKSGMENEFLLQGLWELWYFFCRFIPFVVGKKAKKKKKLNNCHPLWQKKEILMAAWITRQVLCRRGARRSVSYLGLERGSNGSPAGFKCYSEANVCQRWQQVPRSEEPRGLWKTPLAATLLEKSELEFSSSCC